MNFYGSCPFKLVLADKTPESPIYRIESYDEIIGTIGFNKVSKEWLLFLNEGNNVSIDFISKIWSCLLKKLSPQTKNNPS